jgi:hypothetical protein
MTFDAQSTFSANVAAMLQEDPDVLELLESHLPEKQLQGKATLTIRQIREAAQAASNHLTKRPELDAENQSNVTQSLSRMHVTDSAEISCPSHHNQVSTNVNDGYHRTFTTHSTNRLQIIFLT